ncbi:mitochondrial GTPase 1 [Leptopilina heterotoma]|uniref:mitochondrial GTPase 1 n=1 Tax=Leptopilina heterotoma TaxID=63436 RepID=UPI001CA9EEB0|nr:mitochondrial GTPase 1 [Leptopilina heterotoma]
MSSIIRKQVTYGFRKTFLTDRKDFLQWFPGHMGKGLRQMQQKLKNIDLIIEVTDARVPLSGRCHELKNILGDIKPHIYVLNKIDLTDMEHTNQAIDRLKKDGVKNIVVTNFKDQTCKGMKSLLPLAMNLINKSERFNRENECEFSIMVVGIPNVGKSSLINRLRNNHLKKGNAAAVGAVAGITRSVMTRIKIKENIYLVDTPGILSPEIRDIQGGLKLSLAGCILDHLVGPEKMADYLLFWLNKQGRFEYVEKFQLLEPNDNIFDVLGQIAVNLNKTIKLKNFDNKIIVKPNYAYAAELFIKAFRYGELGLYCLDQDILVR